MDVDSDAVAVASHQTTTKNYVKFYPKWVRNNFLSKKENKEVGEYRDFIVVICPGQPKTEMHREAQEKDKAEYRTEWNLYKDGKEQRLSGTPIELLPGIDQSRADSLKAVYIHTIEQLAELSDPGKHSIGMGANDLIQRAKVYMQRNTAEVVNLKQENAILRQSFEVLKDQMAQLQAQMASRPKVGRPRKQPQVAQ